MAGAVDSAAPAGGCGQPPWDKPVACPQPLGKPLTRFPTLTTARATGET